MSRNRAILARLLEEIGAKVRTAADGATALDMSRRRRPDLVFMDIRMPGMSGEETTRRLWDERGRDVMRVVAISASAMEHQRREYVDYGFDAFIDKPFTAERIYACLSELLGVEYEYEEPIAEPGEQAPNLKGFAMPDDLLQRLRAAAESGNVTGLDRELATLEQLGPVAADLALHLRRLSRELQMDEVLATLVHVESD